MKPVPWDTAATTGEPHRSATTARTCGGRNCHSRRRAVRPCGSVEGITRVILSHRGFDGRADAPAGARVARIVGSHSGYESPDTLDPLDRSPMTTVAELLIEALADHGVTQVWGVVGDALNPVTDAIRREDRIEWMGVRHEEAGAFAASAQAQLEDRLGVCMGTVGPGAIHLLNGLYDAKKSHAPVLAICGQVPREEMGSDFFQEVDNDALFADVSVFNQTVTSVDQLPGLIEQAGNAALQLRGVAVLTLPGDVGGLDLPKHTPVPRFVADVPAATPSRDSLHEAAAAINAADRVTLLVGQGARHARAEVLELAGRLQAPMVLTLKAKEGLEEGNPYEVGQSGLIGNRATRIAFDGCDLLFLVGTDFPYKDFLPAGQDRGPARRAGHAHRAAYTRRPPAGR